MSVVVLLLVVCACAPSAGPETKLVLARLADVLVLQMVFLYGRQAVFPLQQCHLLDDARLPGPALRSEGGTTSCPKVARSAPFRQHVCDRHDSTIMELRKQMLLVV